MPSAPLPPSSPPAIAPSATTTFATPAPATSTPALALLTPSTNPPTLAPPGIPQHQPSVVRMREVNNDEEPTTASMVPKPRDFGHPPFPYQGSESGAALSKRSLPVP